MTVDIEKIKSMEISDIVKMRREYKALLEEAEKYVDACDDEIKKFIGDSEEEFFIADSKLSFKTAVRHGLDSKALQKVLPDVYSKFQKDTVYRTLRVS